MNNTLPLKNEREDIQMLKRTIILKAILLMSFGWSSTYATEKAHVHGSAQLNIALEDSKKGEVNFDIPADSVFAFEHEATSKKDKEIVEKALKKLKSEASKIVLFPMSANCTIKNANAEIEKEEHVEKNHEGHHEDVSGGFAFECQSALEESILKIGLNDLFPKIKKISVQILGNTKQMKKTISHSNEEILLNWK